MAGAGRAFSSAAVSGGGRRRTRSEINTDLNRRVTRTPYHRFLGVDKLYLSPMIFPAPTPMSGPSTSKRGTRTVHTTPSPPPSPHCVSTQVQTNSWTTGTRTTLVPPSREEGLSRGGTTPRVGDYFSTPDRRIKLQTLPVFERRGRVGVSRHPTVSDTLRFDYDRPTDQHGFGP